MIQAIPLFHLGAMVASEQYEYRRKMQTGRIADPRVGNIQKRQLRQALDRVKRSYRTGVVGVDNTAVKDEPLPAGRYWIDLFGDDMASFQLWAAYHGDTVKVEKTEHYGAGGWDPLGINPLVEKKPEGDWLVFVVSAPTPWRVQKEIGWPNWAGPKIQTASDTIQKPDPPKNVWDDGFEALPRWVPWAAGGLGVVIVLAIVVRR